MLHNTAGIARLSTPLAESLITPSPSVTTHYVWQRKVRILHVFVGRQTLTRSLVPKQSHSLVVRRPTIPLVHFRSERRRPTLAVPSHLVRQAITTHRINSKEEVYSANQRSVKPQQHHNLHKVGDSSAETLQTIINHSRHRHYSVARITQQINNQQVEVCLVLLQQLNHNHNRLPRYLVARTQVAVLHQAPVFLDRPITIHKTSQHHPFCKHSRFSQARTLRLTSAAAVTIILRRHQHNHRRPSSAHRQLNLKLNNRPTLYLASPPQPAHSAPLWVNRPFKTRINKQFLASRLIFPISAARLDSTTCTMICKNK